MALHRAAAYGYHVVDDFHSLIDESGPARPRILTSGSRKLLVCGMIVSGVALSTINKIVYEIPAAGRDGVVHTFEKPWFMVLVMFLGMAACLPLSLAIDIVRALACRRGSSSSATQQQQQYKGLGPLGDSFRERLLVEGEPEPGGMQQQAYSPPEMQHFLEGGPSSAPSTSVRRRWWLLQRRLWLLVLPAAFDLGTSALLNIGLVYITASATQMLRQSLLLFAALLARWWLRKPLNRYHSLGLLGCLAGLCIVSGATISSGYGGNGPRDTVTHASMALGVSLVLASQLLQAVQLVSDPGAHQRVMLSPLKVVGVEGLLGAALTAFVALPLLSVGRGVEGGGAREDSLDTLAQLGSSRALQVLLLVQLGAVQGYNICGMVIAGDLDTVSTTLLQALRTTFVWMVCLLLRVSPLGGATSSTSSGNGLAAGAPWGSPHPAATGILGSSSAYMGGRGGGAAAAAGCPGCVQLLHPHQAVGHQYSLNLSPAAAVQPLGVAPGYRIPQHNSLQQQQGPAAAAATALGGQQGAGPWLGWLLGLWQHIGSTYSSSSSSSGVGLPDGMQLGEPWGAWSLLQGVGFAIMVAGAVLYSRGDTSQTEYQMLSEAALLLLGTAPSSRPRPESLPAFANTSSRRFTAHMDFDSGSFLRGYARSPLPGPVFTPPLSTPRAASLISAPEAGAAEGGRVSADGLRGLQVMQGGGAESVPGIRWGSPEA